MATAVMVSASAAPRTFHGLYCSGTVLYCFFLMHGVPVFQFVLLAWSAIRTVLHSPCMFHEGGV